MQQGSFRLSTFYLNLSTAKFNVFITQHKIVVGSLLAHISSLASYLVYRLGHIYIEHRPSCRLPVCKHCVICTQVTVINK